jgi:hypothetical protein
MAPARDAPYNARETGRAAATLPVGSEVNAMKAVVGFFDAGATQPARDALLAGGFQPDQVRPLVAADELPPYLEGEPEKSASRGWLAGSIAGALVGALGGWLLMVAFDLRVAPPLAVMFLLIAAGGGAALGGFLTAIYAVRADTQMDMDIREALSEGRALLVVYAGDAEAARAARIMKRRRAEKVEAHLVPEDAVVA